MDKVRRFLASIDIFDKSIEDEFRIRTKTGAIISMLFSSIGVILFFAQLSYFVAPDVSRNLATNKNVTSDVTRVNISISLLVDFPCHLLHLDARDNLGFSQLYANTVTRRRYTRDNQFIAVAPYPALDSCGSCYDARPSGECCNSCEELYLLHLIKGLPATPEKWRQCQGVNRELMPSLNETCLLKGKLTVNKVAGDVSVVFTRSLYSEGAVFEYPNFNLSHVFARLRFGPKIYTTTTPLDGIAVIQNTNEPVQYQYDAVCTGVVLTKDEREVMAQSFEYTIFSTVLPAVPRLVQPGITVRYLFTSFTVMVNFRMKEAMEMIPTVLAVVAGAYVIASLIDGLLYTESSQTPIE